MNEQERFESLAAHLDAYEQVPDDVLADVVTTHGLCFWAFPRGEVPEMNGEEPADRALAAWLCAGCPVIDQCLELELREGGPHTVGVWGALPEDDRRSLYPRWQARRRRSGPDDAPGGQAP